MRLKFDIRMNPDDTDVCFLTQRVPAGISFVFREGDGEPILISGEVISELYAVMQRFAGVAPVAQVTTITRTHEILPHVSAVSLPDMEAPYVAGPVYTPPLPSAFPPPVATHPARRQLSEREKAIDESFLEDAEDVKKNPEKFNNGGTGVSGEQVGSLVRRWRKRYPDSKRMFQVIVKAFPHLREMPDLFEVYYFAQPIREEFIADVK